MPTEQDQELERFHNNVEAGQADRIGWLEAIVRECILRCKPGCNETLNLTSEAGVISVSCPCCTVKVDTNKPIDVKAIGPCPLPWCKGVGVIMDRVVANYPPEHNTYRVVCSLTKSCEANHCDVAGPVRDTATEAIQAWNGCV